MAEQAITKSPDGQYDIIKSPDGRHYVSVINRTATVYINKKNQGNEKIFKVLFPPPIGASRYSPPRPKPIGHIMFTPDSKKLLIPSEDYNLYLLDLESGNANAKKLFDGWWPIYTSQQRSILITDNYIFITWVNGVVQFDYNGNRIAWLGLNWDFVYSFAVYEEDYMVVFGNGSANQGDGSLVAYDLNNPEYEDFVVIHSGKEHNIRKPQKIMRDVDVKEFSEIIFFWKEEGKEKKLYFYDADLSVGNITPKFYRVTGTGP